MAARAKLRCRRRLSRFLSKPFYLFWTFIGHCAKINPDKINNDALVSRVKPSFSLAWVANELINDGHEQHEREASRARHNMWDNDVPTNMVSSWGDKPYMLYCFNHNAIGERFQTKFAKLKVVSPNAMAELAIDSASLESLVINPEIFIPNREIGRFSLFYQKSGDLPPNRETWKLWSCGVAWTLSLMLVDVILVTFRQAFPLHT